MSAPAAGERGGGVGGRPDNVGILAADVYFPSTFVAQVSSSSFILLFYVSCPRFFHVPRPSCLCSRPHTLTMRFGMEGVAAARVVHKFTWLDSDRRTCAFGVSIGLI